MTASKVTPPRLEEAIVQAAGVSRRWSDYVRALGSVVVITGIALLLRPYLQTTDVAMLFLLAIVAVASRYGRGPALWAVVLSVVAFDFLFVPPYYTLDVKDSAYFLTFGVMLVVALLMSRLTARVREQAKEAREREQRTAALYALSRELAEAGSRSEQVAVAARHIGRAAGSQALLVLTEDTGLDGGVPRWPTDGIFDSYELRGAAALAYARGKPTGWSTPQCTDVEALVLPLRTATQILGVAVIRPASSDRPMDPTTRETVQALTDQAAVALERSILAERHEQARAEVEAERLRTALLSSLSHDLRTPLGSIEGAASSLLADTGMLSPEARQDLTETILEESRRMTRLIANLLNMIRVETGTLAVQKAWQPLEEALGVALLRLDDRLQERPVESQLAADLPLVPIDEILLEQVFINLLENAIKYTPPRTPITMRAWREDGCVVVEVADRGPGIPAGSEEAVFHKFYRAAIVDGADSVGGAGLGLTICRGIITAHGGRIWTEPRPGGGAAFRFTLPLQGPPLSVVRTDPPESSWPHRP